LRSVDGFKSALFCIAEWEVLFPQLGKCTPSLIL